MCLTLVLDMRSDQRDLVWIFGLFLFLPYGTVIRTVLTYSLIIEICQQKLLRRMFDYECSRGSGRAVLRLWLLEGRGIPLAIGYRTAYAGPAPSWCCYSSYRRACS